MARKASGWRKVEGGEALKKELEKKINKKKTAPKKATAKRTTTKKPEATAAQKAEESKKKRPRGRPSLYTEELAEKICARLADGESLNSICKDDGMPSERTVRTWALDKNHPFSPKYAQAREIGYLKMADELLDIADDGTNDWMVREREDGSSTELVNHEHIQRSKLRVDTRKWLLSKMLPKVFGDKVSTEVTGKDGKDLIPESTSPRDIARAIADILRTAQIEKD